MLRSFGGIVVALALLPGCGGSGPKLVPVEGTVNIDGRPLANKSLMFTPEAGTEGGVSAGGNTDANGKYMLRAVIPGVTTDQIGIPPGKYRVTVFEPLVSGDVPLETGGEAAPAITMDFNTKSEIPAVYSSETTTPLVLEVPAEGGTLNVELKSTPG